MRTSNNPEKEKRSRNKLWKHRVLIAFFVPDSEEDYFRRLPEVLDRCLKSLVETINPETTCITLVNNASGHRAMQVLDRYAAHIDKIVHYAENKGKVYAVLNEVRGMYEEFVTIADADILFYDGWEQAVFDVFATHPKAGAVSPHPCPYLTFYFNKSAFGWNSFGNIGYGKFVDDHDIDLYVKGVNLPRLIERKGRPFNWKQKQYILKRPTPAVLGAYHVAATYRTGQFRGRTAFPEETFRNSYEEEFIDRLADDAGFYRLSTVQSFIYHMGNTVDDEVLGHCNTGKRLLDPEIFARIKPYVKRGKFPRFIDWLLGRIFIKLKWNR